MISAQNITMKFSLMINATNQWQKSIQHALSLAQCITENGHVINTVFFYGHASQIIQNSALVEPWLEWQKHTQTKFQLCSTLIENHGLSSLANSTDGFEVVSLGSWIQAAEEADKVIELS